MDEEPFEWDEAKDRTNLRKHGVSFSEARGEFEVPHRVILLDAIHSAGEQRYHCLGQVGGGVLTVRFTYRDGRVRIFGAGYWRKGKKTHEEENQIHE